MASNRVRSYFPNAGGMGVNAAEGRTDIGVVDPDTLKVCRARQVEVEKALGLHPSFQALCGGAAVANRIRKAPSRRGSGSSQWQQYGNDRAQNCPAGCAPCAIALALAIATNHVPDAVARFPDDDRDVDEMGRRQHGWNRGPYCER